MIGGCGLGLGYVSPVSTLIRWFPDRRGMAAGMAIMGFGGGAIIAAPLQERLMQAFYRPPEYLGTAAERAADHRRRAGASPRSAAAARGGRRRRRTKSPKCCVPGPAGVYVVGTGTTGVARDVSRARRGLFRRDARGGALVSPARAGLAAGRLDAAGRRRAARRMITTRNVDADRSASRTPQFYLLWIVLCFNVTAGIGVLGVAKTMMTEIFGSSLPRHRHRLVRRDVRADDQRVQHAGPLLLGQRVGLPRPQADLHDLLRRGHRAVLCRFRGSPSRRASRRGVTWLVLFYAVTMLIFTMYGGGFATIPAYLADLFGTRYVGAIHGRLLTAWSTAGVLGPWAITALREHVRAAGDRPTWPQVVSPSDFAARFGAPLDQLPQLIEQKTVTIAKLLELAPPGTVDPSCTLYNTTMYLMAAPAGRRLVANALVRPADSAEHDSD